MAFTHALMTEFDHEMGTTRRLLERLPDARFAWRPHDKSMSMARLATHVAEIPGWGEQILTQDEMNLTGEYTPCEEASGEKVLALFDRSAAKFRATLAGKTDAELAAPWTFKRNGEVLFTLPRGAVIRSMVFNHLVHHRGQLSVYLRMNDVPLPSIYGPTADEK